MNSDHIIVMGAQKCGTSTLFRTLVSHPNIVGPWHPDAKSPVKEIDFFNAHWDRGFAWYQSFFPSVHEKTLDVSPNYLPDPKSHERIARVFPSAKIIVSLRDPVKRAISQFNHYSQMRPKSDCWNWRNPDCDLATNVFEEMKQPFNDWEGFLGRGKYVEQLRNLTRYVRRENILVIVMEEWTSNPVAALQEITRFIDVSNSLDSLKSAHIRKHTVRPPSAELILELLEYYQEYNHQLFDWLGREIPDWQLNGDLVE